MFIYIYVYYYFNSANKTGHMRRGRGRGRGRGYITLSEWSLTHEQLGATPHVPITYSSALVYPQQQSQQPQPQSTTGSRPLTWFRPQGLFVQPQPQPQQQRDIKMSEPCNCLIYLSKNKMCRNLTFHTNVPFSCVASIIKHGVGVHPCEVFVRLCDGSEGVSIDLLHYLEKYHNKKCNGTQQRENVLIAELIAARAMQRPPPQEAKSWFLAQVKFIFTERVSCAALVDGYIQQWFGETVQVVSAKMILPPTEEDKRHKSLKDENKTLRFLLDELEQKQKQDEDTQERNMHATMNAIKHLETIQRLYYQGNIVVGQIADILSREAFIEFSILNRLFQEANDICDEIHSHVIQVENTPVIIGVHIACSECKMRTMMNKRNTNTTLGVVLARTLENVILANSRCASCWARSMNFESLPEKKVDLEEKESITYLLNFLYKLWSDDNVLLSNHLRNWQAFGKNISFFFDVPIQELLQDFELPLIRDNLKKIIIGYCNLLVDEEVCMVCQRGREDEDCGIWPEPIPMVQICKECPHFKACISCYYNMDTKAQGFNLDALDALDVLNGLRMDGKVGRLPPLVEPLTPCINSPGLCRLANIWNVYVLGYFEPNPDPFDYSDDEDLKIIPELVVDGVDSDDESDAEASDDDDGQEPVYDDNNREQEFVDDENNEEQESVNGENNEWEQVSVDEEQKSDDEQEINVPTWFDNPLQHQPYAPIVVALHLPNIRRIVPVHVPTGPESDSD